MGGCGGDKRVLVPLCRLCHEGYDAGRQVPELGSWGSLLELSARLWLESPHYDGRDHPSIIRDGREVSRWETGSEASE